MKESLSVSAFVDSFGLNTMVLHLQRSHLENSLVTSTGLSGDLCYIWEEYEIEFSTFAVSVMCLRSPDS